MLALADALSLSRLAIAPVLPFVAASGAQRATLLLIACGLASDAVDGTVARWTGTAGERGARLDSLCDLAFYSSGIVSFGIAYSAPGNDLTFILALTAAALVVPSVFGWLKFGRVPSYHTLLSRLALVAFSVALLAFFVGGAAWPIRVAAALAVVSALEDMLITARLREPRSDVPHALSLTRNTQRMHSHE
jgi:CDP-diacylglycerol--glycerol-3-phosphate 3-phosphatidyltransferase